MRKKFKVTPKLKAKLNKLAKQVGVKLNWKRSCGIQWDTVDIACKGQDASNILHDIAHFEMATKGARNHYDFGLGFGPETSNLRALDHRDFIEIYSQKKCAHIEKLTSALGIYWEKQLGLPWQHTMFYHFWSWDKEHKGDSLKETWRNMRKRLNKYEL